MPERRNSWKQHYIRTGTGGETQSRLSAGLYRTCATVVRSSWANWLSRQVRSRPLLSLARRRFPNLNSGDLDRSTLSSLGEHCRHSRSCEVRAKYVLEKVVISSECL